MIPLWKRFPRHTFSTWSTYGQQKNPLLLEVPLRWVIS
uniref:Uncharacterized protein n=1 Tax=Anguilla anguilla TaxID=7936 RepID=A0A0E9T168_ANGAN